MKKFIVLTAFVVAASPAFAASWVETSNCRYSRFYGFHQCTRTLTEVAAPVRDPERERQEAQLREQRAEKWEAFCKPTFWVDEYGMHRAVYAHDGCEFGRSE